MPRRAPGPAARCVRSRSRSSPPWWSAQRSAAGPRQRPSGRMPAPRFGAQGRPARSGTLRVRIRQGVHSGGWCGSAIEALIGDQLLDRSRNKVADGAARRHSLTNLGAADVERRSVQQVDARRGSAESGAERRVISRRRGPSAVRPPTRSAPGADRAPASSRSVRANRPREPGRGAPEPGIGPRSWTTLSTVNDGPGRSSSMVDISKSGFPAIAALVIASRSSARGSGWPILCGGSAAGMKRTRSSSSASATNVASHRWPRCGGSKVPPRTPMRS